MEIVAMEVPAGAEAEFTDANPDDVQAYVVFRPGEGLWLQLPTGYELRSLERNDAVGMQDGTPRDGMRVLFSK